MKNLRSSKMALAALLVAGSAMAWCDAASPTSVTTLNGKVPPGRVLPLQNVSVMIDEVDGNGMRVLIVRGTRKAGTRIGIHVHQYGGYTCVLSGDITVFMEGHEPSMQPAGSCYLMPPNVPMAAANLGSGEVELMDIFSLPPGVEPMTVLEPGYDATAKE